MNLTYNEHGRASRSIVRDKESKKLFPSFPLSSNCFLIFSGTLHRFNRCWQTKAEFERYEPKGMADRRGAY